MDGGFFADGGFSALFLRTGHPVFYLLAKESEKQWPSAW